MNHLMPVKRVLNSLITLSTFKRHHMCKDLHKAAGLGSPPAIFNTNSSEVLNSVLKK